MKQTSPTEASLVEDPAIRFLQELGYTYVNPALHPSLREGDNHAIFRTQLENAVARLNEVSLEVAHSVASELLGKTDNEEWLKLLRGNYSRTVPGKTTQQTIKLIDFDNVDNNVFVVTHQLTIKGANTRRPDVVIYVNGLPLVVLEAKSPIAKETIDDAITQIRIYEADVPRLFFTNQFNIATDGKRLRYGATGASKGHWAEWKDPWPRKAGEFRDPVELGLWSLLEKGRLLDLVAHFVVFERDPDSGSVTKKLCRYQQYRAVNKLVARVAEGKLKQGLTWHTQGSGKSLTMVFAALKLKFHRGVQSERLTNPNVLVLTDRIDLDNQITNTFHACGLPNPEHVGSKEALHALVRGRPKGRVLLSTIFKFANSSEAIPNSEDWVLLVDEAHRTQEKDLGAYLRATFPHAFRFGFTGTPIKKADKNTYANFGVPGEAYLDKYGIDDAVADGATVPIYYLARKTEWHLHDKELDVVFDTWFSDQPDETIDELKKRGITIGDLARFEPRIKLIALDIWTHYKAFVMPDGLKAQIVAIDRKACTAYKRALDDVITKDLMVTEKLAEPEARVRASAMSACVYSSNEKEDRRPGNEDLLEFYLDEEAEKHAKERFKSKNDPLRFLIVCNKLLTGFDAPIEAAMYLDNPLTDHNLLQAIARTNRTFDMKQRGVIVDYIGVTKKLGEALAAYRSEDVEHAMRDEEELRARLKGAHQEVIEILKGIDRTGDLKVAANRVLERLGSEDAWFTFRKKAKAFFDAYAAVAPDPYVLGFKDDLKWVAVIVSLGASRFEHKEEIDFRDFSQKIRSMLAQHLEVTGLTTLVKLRAITDPQFWFDFEESTREGDLQTAAVRKLNELKKVLNEKVAESPAQYGRFSERVRELIEKFEKGQLDAAELLKAAEEVAKAVVDEGKAFQKSVLAEKPYAIWKMLVAAPNPGATEGALEAAATEIAAVYDDNGSAPAGWHLKPTLMKELRQRVRRIARDAGVVTWKDIPETVEQYALRAWLKT